MFFSSLSRVPFTRLFLENISLTSKTQFRIYFANLLLIQSMFTWMLFFLVQHCLRYLPQKHHFCDSGSMNRVIENWLSWRFSKPVSKCGLIILSDNSKCINSLDFRIREKALQTHTHTGKIWNLTQCSRYYWYHTISTLNIPTWYLSPCFVHDKQYGTIEVQRN